MKVLIEVFIWGGMFFFWRTDNIDFLFIGCIFAYIFHSYSLEKKIEKLENKIDERNKLDE